MNFSKTIRLPLLMLFSFQTVIAQLSTLPGYTVQTFGTADGLASSEIVSLYQDKKDFLWIGTRSGISRYDGYSFQNFEYINNGRIGSVNSIAEDKTGVLWMATESGLYHWDGKTFVHYPLKNEAGYLPYTVIHFTGTGEAWLGTAKGPLLFSSLQKNKTVDVTKALVKDWEKIAFDDGSVTAISSAAKGVVFGAYKSIYVYQNGQLKKIPNRAGDRDFVRNVFIDDKGDVYWNNVLSGFFCWDGTSVRNLSGGDAFYFDIFSKSKKIYVYTNAGILSADALSKQLTTLADISKLELRSPSCLLVDKEGNYWAGSTEGLFSIKKNEFKLHVNNKVRYSDDIYSLLRRKNGELLLGANRGSILKMDGELQPYKSLPQVVPLAEVFSMYEDEKQGLWFGTGYQGIAHYKNGKLQNFTTKNGLPDNSHFSFFASSNGGFWSAGDMGITKITRVSDDSFTFRPFFYLQQPGFHKLYGIVQSPKGVIWTAGQLGMFYLDKDTLLTYTIPELKKQKLYVTAIKQDKAGAVWLSTRGHGILRCTFGSDDKLHLKQQWTTGNGTNSNTYLSIAFDEKGNAWAGSNHGVTSLIPSPDKTYAIKNFDVRDGFINKNYQSLSMYADGDTMWACTSSGPVSFRPAALLQQQRGAQLYITSVDLLNTTKSADEFVINRGKNNEVEYNFPNSINSFSIQFAALYYSNPKAVRYYYRLQGVDSAWTSTGNDRTILFRQLAPGNYKLLVKASIGGSDWTNTATLFFQIKKPWWLQWWAIASAVIIASSVILYFIKSREKKLKHQEQQKTELEKLKSASYQHQLEIEQVVNYFATSLNEHTTIDGVLWDVARNCISHLGFEDCVIYLKNEQGDKLIQKAAWGPKTTEENKIINPIDIELGKGIVGSVALSGKAERLDDTSKDERYIVDDVARASEISVPIFDEGNVIGVIDSEHSRKNFYTDRHLHILTTIASHCGAKISTLKAEAKTASARMEALLNKQKALEASLQSMRLQMNPHFLFNALNSIQQMILSGDETTATRFLSKFSKLLRTVLTNSDKEEISLKEEMELLQLYVELESLRFKESFTYKIDCDVTIDAEEIFVPALFFQPMVENAIWHGLMHKTGYRKLAVEFKECNEGCLLCIIEDNGVGRQAAQKNGSGQVHTGKGLSVAVERLSALNEKNGTKNELQIIDLQDEKGSAAGTRIEIMLHYQ